MTVLTPPSIAYLSLDCFRDELFIDSVVQRLVFILVFATRRGPSTQNEPSVVKSYFVVPLRETFRLVGRIAAATVDQLSATSNKPQP